MQLLIQGTNVRLTDAIQVHAEQSLRGALSRVMDRVQGVMVRVMDVNGPKGGINKRCKVRVDLLDGRSMLLEETDDDLYRAIARVAGRAKRVVIKEIRRLRDLRRRAA
ncbi:MAG: HPF/RaiA family ribosome-associated protein [Phycisphaeraceae bacterium]|nr:HPF/RaiA family ribosome-associated protein [Phycisphaerales bacterium]QOJ17730.1 MAG: HPF/RaiA family ribosome-associated protein [Phycisphaeraceae bacterium]